ncbi:MAG: DedA family protein [Candidatus Doudnabacteria bacterium]|nr:DedA family protein [Candidatus Doudnabacteria bacterium]
MIESILSLVTNFVINIISTLGYPAVTLLMAIESAAIPLPSEVIMPFSGFLVSQGRFGLYGIALAGALGSVFGSWVTYWLGRYGGRPLVERYGKYVLISRNDLEISDRFFARFGMWATFLARMMPVIRTYISIPAGISRVKFWPFTIACFIGSFIWSYFLGWIGFKLGENWESLRVIFRQLDWLIIILLIAGIAWWIRRHIVSSKSKNQNAKLSTKT